MGCFFVGGIAGALGFKNWGYLTTLPLAAVLSVLVWGPLSHDIRAGRIAPALPRRPTAPPGPPPAA